MGVQKGDVLDVGGGGGSGDEGNGGLYAAFISQPVGGWIGITTEGSISGMNGPPRSMFSSSSIRLDARKLCVGSRYADFNPFFGLNDGMAIEWKCSNALPTGDCDQNRRLPRFLQVQGVRVSSSTS